MSNKQQPAKSRVKNKQAAPMQITAEQLMREAQERQEPEYKPPKQKIVNVEELEHYRVTKRKQFEDSIRRNQNVVSNWVKYAKFEEEQQDFKRARSIYERALAVDYREPRVYLNYAEMEMRHKKVNRARNIWERAIETLPRVDAFWLRYIFLEEILGNFVNTRQIFERWMEWEPAERAWNAYINFEVRHKEVEQARSVYSRFVQCHPRARTWIRWAKFEYKNGEIENTREVYTKALEFLSENHQELEQILICFAEFETMVQEYERSRAIYKYALDNIPKSKAQEIYNKFISFEKQHGDKIGIEDAIINKRRFQYEEELKINSKNYDIWFDYIRLEESVGDKERIRELYERSIANIPPANEKRFWRRYIYLWINYALYEEITCRDIERSREVYKECLNIIPHKQFSFSKIWIMFANFEIRQKEVSKARLVFGNAIGKAPKDKIFISYISLESKLGNIDRVRNLYEKWLEMFPHNCTAWKNYAELEDQLNEVERARQIYELAIDQPLLDMPELVWKSYIDFEIEKDEYGLVRDLYNRLLDRTQHVKVWISFAQFEETLEQFENAREIYSRAYIALKNTEVKEERLLLVETWRDFEEEHGNADQSNFVKKKMPQRVKKRREIDNGDGSTAGFEEYYDYIFPDDTSVPNLKILDIAHKWKKQKTTTDEN